ncbi:MAG: amidase family protein [Bryobacteraceae bacterium]
MAKMIRAREISSLELITKHLEQIQRINPSINAVVELLADSAVSDAKAADARLNSGEICGPLHGVPFSIKDSIDVRGTKCTAGTLGRKNAALPQADASVVYRLRGAGAIPIAKTNLPDLLFSFESDNLIYGRSNNPYDLTRTPGGSSGGESALIAASGSPIGLGSDAAGSVRVPAAFCGIASIKPTSGRLPRTGHVPPAGGWIEALWQIGPMARYTEDLVLAMQLLCGEDGPDFTSPPAPLIPAENLRSCRVAFFTDNGFAQCTSEVQGAVRRSASFLSENGMVVEERRPPGVEHAYELELALLGADGADGIDRYLEEAGSTEVHPLLSGFLNHMRPFRATASQLGTRWAQWDEYRSGLASFFNRYDAILCPAYTQPALKHLDSLKDSNFEGFSYTMAWNVAGAPAATVRCAEVDGLPINVQVVTKRWRDLLALEICRMIEHQFGGWQPSPLSI